MVYTIIFLLIGLLLISLYIIFKFKQSEKKLELSLGLFLGLIFVLLAFLPNLLDYTILHGPKIIVHLNVDSIFSKNIYYHFNLKNEGDLPANHLLHLFISPELTSFNNEDSGNVELDKGDEITYDGTIIPETIRDSVSYKLIFEIYYSTNILWMEKCYKKNTTFNIQINNLKPGEFNPQTITNEELSSYDFKKINENFSKASVNDSGTMFMVLIDTSFTDSTYNFYQCLSDNDKIKIFYNSFKKEILTLKEIHSGRKYLLKGKYDSKRVTIICLEWSINFIKLYLNNILCDSVSTYDTLKYPL